MTEHTRLGFLGVSTNGSSIQRVFPAWAQALGLDQTHLVGHDLALDSTDADYRNVIRALAADHRYAGALITTHKIGIFRAAADQFDSIDPFARRCGEISSISKRDGRLIGHAKDPITSGMALEEIIDADHFTATGANALILGSGGAATAIAWHLAGRVDAPRHIVCTGIDAGALKHLRSVVAARGEDPPPLDTQLVDGPADALLAQQPPGSLVVNATGMGKDRPGSPIEDAAAFPVNALAWELNYRGSLEFWHQARAARIRAADGWRYFIHGWSQVIAEVFDLRLTPADIERLATLAEATP